MEGINDVILRFGYHGSEKLLEKGFQALGLGHWGRGKKGISDGEFPEQLKKEKKWMSNLTADEVMLLYFYFHKARSLAYRYLRSRIAKKMAKANS